MPSTDEQLKRLVEQLQQMPSLAETLPGDQGTDPGVTGGYGDTGFGSIGNKPPVPAPGEPTDQG